MWDDVLQKIALLKSYDRTFKVLYAPHHRYEFNPTVPEAEIARFEETLGVRLPDQLRTFYLEIGNGGAGPDYGLYPMEQLEGYRAEQPWMGVEWYDSQEGEYEETLTGLLVLMDRYYNHQSCMVTNGEHAGRMIAVNTISFMYEEAESLTDVYHHWLDRNIDHFERIIDLIGDGASTQELVWQMAEHHNAHPANTLAETASLLGFEFAYHPDGLNALTWEDLPDGNRRAHLSADVQALFDPGLKRFRERERPEQ